MIDPIVELKLAIRENVENGYSSLFDFQALEGCLERPGGNALQLFLDLRRKRPGLDSLNWLCLVVGALNYASFYLSDDEQLSSPDKIEALLRRHFDRIWELCTTKNNNPTVPQRAVPFAYELKDSPRTCVIELGCSRGDIGLVMLDVDAFLSGDWFFPNWGRQTTKSLLRECKSAHKYLGVDTGLECDDEWLLSLWGRHDPRRDVLGNYYRNHAPLETERFSRISADATLLSAYADIAMKWSSGCENVLFVTSYMLYQLTPSRRILLARNIREITETLRARGIGVTWLNQGIAPEAAFQGQIRLDDIWLCEFAFEGANIIAKRRAKIEDDTCQNWEMPSSRDQEPVFISCLDAIDH
ncbi:MAG: hypothetical protein ABJZ55_01100 [Fuerstiella sp.]